MTKKEALINCIENAIDYRQKYVGVLINLPKDKKELIIFQRDSYVEKMNYYDNAYTEELELKSSNGKVNIENFCCADSLEQVEIELMEG
ncbi:hypothetical protein UT300009_30160 [Paraclostridium bifermentans]